MAVDLGAASLAVGALGTASYGIVDALKIFSWFDLSGFENIFSCNTGGRWWPKKPKANLDQLYPALQLVYGDDAMDVYKAQYRAGRATAELKENLKRDILDGLGKMKSEAIIKTLHGLGISEKSTRLVIEGFKQERILNTQITGEATQPSPSKSEASDALEQLKARIDTRVNAALLLANSQFTTQSRLYATGISLAFALSFGTFSLGQNFGLCFLIGIAAVPLAPVAKDLSTALQATAKALGKK